MPCEVGWLATGVSNSKLSGSSLAARWRERSICRRCVRPTRPLCDFSSHKSKWPDRRNWTSRPSSPPAPSIRSASGFSVLINTAFIRSYVLGGICDQFNSVMNESLWSAEVRLGFSIFIGRCEPENYYTTATDDSRAITLPELHRAELRSENGRGPGI